MRQPPGIGFTGPTGLVGIVVVVVGTVVEVVVVVVVGVVEVGEVDVALEDVTGGATGTPVVSVTVAVDVEVDGGAEDVEPAGASTAQATRPRRASTPPRRATASKTQPARCTLPARKVLGWILWRPNGLSHRGNRRCCTTAKCAWAAA